MSGENEKIEYPLAHERGKEIAEVKNAIDRSFTAYKNFMDGARFQYKIAKSAQEEMGKCLEKAVLELKFIAPKLEELKELIESPLI